MTPTTSQFGVSGMTCEHCVAAVTDEVSRIDGVMEVAVALVPGGQSTVTVTSTDQLPPHAVRDAVDEAGYELTGGPS